MLGREKIWIIFQGENSGVSFDILSLLIVTWLFLLDKAYSNDQKYKEGKFILEKAMTG